MEIIRTQNILTLVFSAKIDYTISASFNKIFGSIKKDFEILELDFYKTKFITLPASMYLLFIVYALTKSSEKTVIESRITNCLESVLTAIANFGLIKMLKAYGNLRVDNYTNELSEERFQFWKTTLKSNYLFKTLYWPISAIPSDPRKNENFVTAANSLINSFIDCFNNLLVNSMVKNVSGEDNEFFRKSFISAVNESIKNIWDHSESWGTVGLHSNKYQKNTFCLFDYGIGFINSYIKRIGSFERNSINDKAKLEWLFKEGHTSNDMNNHGRGLKKIADFVDMNDGIWYIKTDKYLMKYQKQKLTIDEDSFFPGTQLMINF